MKLLITSIDQLRKFVKINASTSFDTYKGFIEDAQLRYIIPYFGEKLIEDLILTPTDTLTIRILKALSPFSLAMATYELSINFGESGHTVTRTDKLAPASDEKIEKALESLFNRAWLNLDDALKYVFNHQLEYPLWIESDFMKKTKTSLFNDAVDFQDNGMVDIDYSPLTFHRLRMMIIRIEKTETFPLVNNLSISDNLRNAMKAYTASRVAEIVTSQTTRVQRSQPGNKMEFSPIIRPAYDENNTGNFYEQQTNIFKQKIQDILIEEKLITAPDNSIYFNNEERTIFFSGAKREL